MRQATSVIIAIRYLQVNSFFQFLLSKNPAMSIELKSSARGSATGRPSLADLYMPSRVSTEEKPA